MPVKVYGSQYKDQPAITIEFAVLSAAYLPGVGAKLASLVHRPTGLELLIQRPAAAYRLAGYDGEYVNEGECSGLDDMFPSIDRCYYESDPWRGTPIPDHGEVWSLPWECTPGAEGDSLHFATYGVRFPYRLEKWIAFAGEGTLRSRYRLTNLAPFDFDFMWAAHPMFVLEEGAELRLPAGVAKAVTIFSLSGAFGRYGDEFTWPAATLADGSRLDMRRVRPEATRDTEKYFIKGKLPAGWCELTYPRSGVTLRLEFPVQQVPYLAVLSNAGGWQDLYNIFLEPATAPFDRLDVARLHGECSTVKAKSTYEWYLDILLA